MAEPMKPGPDAVDEVTWLRELVKDAATDSLALTLGSAAQVVADIAPAMLGVVAVADRLCRAEAAEPSASFDAELGYSWEMLQEVVPAFRAAVREEMSR